MAHHKYILNLFCQYRRDLYAGEKRGLAVGKTKRGKGTKIMAIADAAGFPVAAHVESASPYEVKLVEATIDSGFTQYAPYRLLAIKSMTETGLMHSCLKTAKLS